MLEHENTLILGQDADAIQVAIRKSARASKIALKISPVKGVELVVPNHISIKKAIDFLKEKEDWTLQKAHENKINEKIVVQEGLDIKIMGKLYTIEHDESLRGVTRIEDNKIIVPGDKGLLGHKLFRFLKELAKKEITQRAKIDAEKIGKKFQKITVRDTTTRWGSCSSKGNLSFSWRLIFAPSEVMQYVISHEVAHLSEMNHSRNFWKIVESIYPRHKDARRWLKDHGSKLHSYTV